MSYFIWVPFVTILFIIQSWLTVKNNTDGGMWFWIYFVSSLVTPWVLISKYSKDIILDAMIFDSILVVTYSVGLLYFTNSLTKLSFYQYVGCFLIGAGIFLFKKGI